MIASFRNLDSRQRAFVAVTWLVFAGVVLWILGPLVRGYFLSDDFVPLVLFRHWQDQGRFGSEVFHKFYSGLDAGANNFYRPLSYLTFALNYVTSGLDAGHWLALNLALHVASGVMAGAIGVIAVDARGSRAWLGAALGAALFVFFSPGSEVVGWISGRFDVTATFFSVLSCLLFLVSRRHGDAASVVSLASAFAAFLCKESAASLPFAIALLALLRVGEGLPLWSPRRWMAAAWRAGPWLAVAVIYLCARYAFFGSFTRVYAGSSPVAAMLTAAYWSDLASTIPVWLDARFPVQGHRRAMAVFVVAHLAALAWVAFARSGAARAREAILVLAGIVVLTVILVAPHIGKLPPNGIGGRLVYQTAAFYAAMAAAAFAIARPVVPFAAVSILLVLVNVGAMREAMKRHQSAFTQMQALIAEVQREYREVPPGGYTLIMTPAYHRNIPFAVNAQAGLLMPPVMPQPLAGKVLVQIDYELNTLAITIDKGVMEGLRRYPLSDMFDGIAHDPLPRTFPTRVTCWNEDLVRLVPLDVKPGESTKAYVDDVRAAYLRAGCRISMI